MQDKRGISAIVATVLIILITVAAVTIVWAAIIPMIKTNLEMGTICLDADVLIDDTSGYTCYDSNKSIVAVQVKKGSNDVDVSDIDIVLTSGGISKNIVTPFGLSPNAKKTFYVPLIADSEEASISPVISIGNSKKTCDITDKVELRECNLASFAVGSCLEWFNRGNKEDGVYWIDPDGIGGISPFEVNCDMTRDGGGWTEIVKTWYVSSTVSAGVFGETGAVGDVSDGLTHLGNGYKLSDDAIRAIIGPNQKFSILADQSGYNTAYSTGNYEYVILRDYTGYWRFDGPVLASTPQQLFNPIEYLMMLWHGLEICNVDIMLGRAWLALIVILF